MENCYNIGNVSGTLDCMGGVVGINECTNNAISTVKNCYYLKGKANVAIGENNATAIDVESKDESCFTCGELAYFLQSLQDEKSGLVWGQRLTTGDGHDNGPILTSNEDYRVLKITFKYNDKSAVNYDNPNTTFVPKTDDLPKPPKGYILGWTTDPNGETAVFYDTVTVGDKDTTFYAILVEIPMQDPEVTPPRPIYRIYDGEERKLVKAGAVPEGCTMLYILDEYGVYSEDIPTGINAGDYTVWYKVIGDDNYNDTMLQSLIVTIAKATPVPDIPYLTATYGQTLAEVELPDSFEWVDNTQDVGDVGENFFAAKYTPNDIKNFNVLFLTLTVEVLEKPAEKTTTTQATTTTTTTATVTSEEPVETSVSTAAATTATTTPVTEVTFFIDVEDKNQPTGVALAVIPFIAAAIGAVISRKRK